MSKATYATITLELSKAGIHAYCEETDEDCFCIGGNLEPLVKLINDAEICNPDTRFSLTGKGRKSLNELTAEDIQEALEQNKGDPPIRRVVKGGGHLGKIDPIHGLLDALYCFDLNEGRIEK